MNKGDLVNEVAKVLNTKKEAQELGGHWKRRTRSLVAFGTFKVAQRKARKGINPQTGAEIRISAKKVARFVPREASKDAVK